MAVGHADAGEIARLLRWKENASNALGERDARIDAALAKLLLYRESASPDSLRDAMREAVKALRGEK